MIDIHVIACLEDNYAYLVVNTDNHKAVLIDVPEAKPILAKIASLNVHLEAILITHHHNDHVDGLLDLNLPSALIIGNGADVARLPKLDVETSAGAKFIIADMHFEAMNCDGHTKHQLAYYLPEKSALFSADSLMTWGCGRIFDGSFEEAFETLECISALPDDTLIYSGHNYGVAGGRFAISLGVELEQLQIRMDKIVAQNNAGAPIVPVFLSEEKATNPFLKCHDDHYADALGIKALTPLERFGHIRDLRNKF